MQKAPEDLVALLFDLQSKLLGQQDLLEQKQQETDQLSAELTALREREADLQARLQAGAAALIQAQARHEDDLRRTEALEAELARIHTSKAWRLTAPLRRLRAGLSGRR